MANNLVFIVMDSCRFDSYARAKRPNMDRIGAGERRYSYASWTAPSHQSLFMGQLPHQNPQGVFASEIYKKDYLKWIDRFGTGELSFKTFVPEMSLAKVAQGLGYRTVARVSMPILNPFAGFNRFFDDYRLMSNHNDFAGMVEEVEFSPDEPTFYFFNLGETHYPYMLKSGELPIISGLHGVARDLDDIVLRSSENADEPTLFFSMQKLGELHDQQVRCVEHVDEILGYLLEKCPENTHLIVTADHGELFGEGGFFGHGPVMHEKCFEVPFLEGRKP